MDSEQKTREQEETVRERNAAWLKNLLPAKAA